MGRIQGCAKDYTESQDNNEILALSWLKKEVVVFSISEKNTSTMEETGFTLEEYIAQLIRESETKQVAEGEPAPNEASQ